MCGCRHTLGALKWQKIIVTNRIWLTNKIQTLRSFVLIGLNRFDVHRSLSVTFTITCLILSVLNVDARAWPGTPSNKIYSLLTSVCILSLMVIMSKPKKIWPNNWFLFLKENALTPKVKIKFDRNLEKMVRFVSHVIQHCGYSEWAERHPKHHGEINCTIRPLLLVLFVKICDNWKVSFTHYRVCKI